MFGILKKLLSNDGIEVTVPKLRKGKDGQVGYVGNEIEEYVMALFNQPVRYEVNLEKMDLLLFSMVVDKHINVYTVDRHWSESMYGIPAHYDVAAGLKRLIIGGYLYVRVRYDVNIHVTTLKEVLATKGLSTQGRKAELLNRVKENFTHDELLYSPLWRHRYFTPMEKYQKLWAQVQKKHYSEFL